MRLRKDRLESRQQEAKDRKEAYAKLTDEDKIKRLDINFGVGIGAKKQRARLEKE